ncbi:MAG TPA: hypothetical protein VEO54_24655 [Thermoanaerobaculia bacterium]|nr:hypothetical protein [Thermoanaerobaculia bacterium]
MKKAILVIICLVAQAESLDAACKSEACKRATAWKSGYTAVILDDDIGREDYFAILAAIQARKGVVAIEAERVLLGWVPRAAAAEVRATRGVKAVLYDAVPRPETMVRHEGALDALAFFNSVLTGEYEDVIEAGQARTGEPLVGCVVERPAAASSVSVSQSIRSDRGDALADVIEDRFGQGTKSGRRVAANSSTPPFNNPHMSGRITVQLFRLDSDGTVDLNRYTWTATDFRIARDQVYGAFTVWVNQAASRNVPLSFTVNIVDPYSRYTRNFSPTPTRYEPITRSSEEAYLWVNDALARHGYSASPLTFDEVYKKNDAFNAAMAADPVYGPFDGSFSVYIVYNPPPASGNFANGRRAFAVADGPLVMMMWNSSGWGPEKLGRVLEHETGHIFWACDEYYDAASNTGCFSCDTCMFNIGPRNKFTTPWITNANCEHPAATGCDMPKTTCIMQSVGSGNLCQHTRDQIGW